HESKTSRIQVGSPTAGFFELALYVFGSQLRHLHGANISAVHRETSRDFDQSFHQLAARQFPRIAVMGGKLRQSLPEGAHLHAQQSAHDELFLLVNNVSKFVLATDKGG